MEYRRYSEIPVPSGSEILFIPQDNFLIHDLTSPVDNSKQFPEWWTSLERSINGDGAIRSCEATKDYMSEGYTLKLWCDAHMRPSLQGPGWECLYDAASFNDYSELLKVGSFPYRSVGKCPMTDVRKIEKANYVKLVNPWLIKTAPGYSSLILPTLYEPNNKYSVLPAIVNTDYYHTVHIVLNILHDEEFTISAGTPMFHIIPFKRKLNQKLDILDSSAFRFLKESGFGTLIQPRNRKGLYRKVQKKYKKEMYKDNE